MWRLCQCVYGSPACNANKAIPMYSNQYPNHFKNSDRDRIALAMEVAGDGIWDWNVETNEVFFDRRYYSMAGYNPGEFPGTFEAWEKRVHPQDLPKVKAKLNQCFQGQAESFQSDFRFRTKQGPWMWIRGRGKVFGRHSRSKPKRIIGTHSDITELKREVEKRINSEKGYRLLIENAHDCIFVAQGGVIKYANTHTARLSGYPLQELQRIAFIDLVHPEDRAMVKGYHLRRMQGDKQPQFYAFRIKNKSGVELHLENNAVYIEWEKKPASINFVRDITKTKKMEQQMTQTQKMQAIGTLAGGIAHDFNNILSAMMGYTEISLLEMAPESKAYQRLHNVLQAGNRARDLVHQILTFSRETYQESKPVPISAIVKEAMKLLRASIPASIEFIQDIDADAGNVLADSTRIHQVIMNLCTNASHSMLARGGTLEVRLENFQIDESLAGDYLNLDAGSYVCLTVSDTGHGMDPETLKQIFDPYFSTKEPGEGTGLGLSVVHGIVSGLGGSIKVYSEQGTGTTFNVILPRIESEDREVNEWPRIYPGGSETILLVDDEEAVLDVTREMLETLGYQVISRISSLEAYQAFLTTPDRFDLVITDHTMPKMSGIELIHKMLVTRKSLPIILCTGFSAGITRKKMDTIGAQAMLNKPVLKQELAQTIRKVLDDQRVNSGSEQEDIFPTSS